jgi:hypothetical protein
MDLAASVQKVTEEIVLRIARNLATTPLASRSIASPMARLCVMVASSHLGSTRVVRWQCRFPIKRSNLIRRFFKKHDMIDVVQDRSLAVDYKNKFELD